MTVIAPLTLQQDAAAIAPRMVALRRDLHRTPEIGLDLPLTQARVLEDLRDLDLEITLGRGCSSIVAVLRGTHPDRPANAGAVLLRGDMDALSVTERNDLDYASEIDGRMHACGHDLHTAMLAGAARMLADRRQELAGDVILMFQPGEEMHDGAQVMLDEGVLEAAGGEVVAAYAIHVFASRYAPGHIVTRAGAMLAAADGFSVVITGRGGHSSAPHNALDPVTIAAECVLALQSYVTRRVDIFDPIVLGIGHISGGDQHAPNAIPETVRFDASVRFWSPVSRERFHREAAELVRGIAAAHGAVATVESNSGYPATINSEAEVAFAADVARGLVGDDRFELLDHPLAASEDFSRILERVPGAFLGLGAAPAGDVAAADNHSPLAQFDDSVLADGAALHASLAIARLASAAATH